MDTTQITVRVSSNVLARLDEHIKTHPAMSRSTVIDEALEAFPPIATRSRRGSAPPGAGQDEKTGQAGRDFGVTAGRAIARQLGELISPVATELTLRDGRQATVRTAKNRNVQWGCLHTVRDRVDVIICAYTKDQKTFNLWEVTPAEWRTIERKVSPGNKSYGRLTLVSKSDVDRIGKRLPEIILHM